MDTRESGAVDQVDEPGRVLPGPGQRTLFQLPADDLSGDDASADGMSPDGEPGDAAGLCALHRDILDFERRAWTRPGDKEQQIKELFGMTAIRYFQLLNRIIDTRDALEYAPVVVNRLRRVRSSRARRVAPR